MAAGVALIAQGEELLATLPDDAYVRRTPAAWNGTIGGHYRHCLDHFQSLLDGASDGEVDYDHRARDPRVERDRAFAFERTRQLRRQLEALDPATLVRPVVAHCEVSYNSDDTSVTNSTFARELVYSITHAIHHFALIGVLANLMGARLPAKFGVAPSTVKHRSDLAVAA
ncbi:MAG: DinB family protein [Rhodobacteraceae bacterium]|nr:DinB family protein [Paracoccaceae bacterium]